MKLRWWAVSGILLLAAAAVALLPGSSGSTPEGNQPGHTKIVYDSPLAGKWYPADRGELKAELAEYTQIASQDMPSPPPKDIAALLLPHAGYEFSGQTASYGIAGLKGKTYKRVVVLGPTHQVNFPNAASVPRDTHYRTPLGEVALDTAFLDQLVQHPHFQRVPAAHRGEHSVQIELPLLQAALKDFLFVPIVVGQVDVATAKEMAKILTGLVDTETLVVASSDFTHYGERFDYVPFTENIASGIRRLDMQAFGFIEKKNLKGFLGFCRKRRATICGRDPIAVLLAMLPKDARVRMLHYDTSGRQASDFSSSISYLSAVAEGKWPRTSSGEVLSATDKANLLTLARRALTFRVTRGSTPSVADLDVPVTDGMEQVMGAFVTLHKHGRLRGCIGEIKPRRELYQAVMAHAINAGFEDSRFPAVTADELPRLHVEISALTPPKPVASYRDIVIGKHGIFIQRGWRSAVYLPQVAPEQGWDLATTLTHLSRKAGLSKDAWKEGARFAVFEAIAFQERADREVDAP